jgi:hypothetical protein
MDTEYLAGYTLGSMGFACPADVSDAFRAGFFDGQMSLVKRPAV